jgi:hypothetical protein
MIESYSGPEGATQAEVDALPGGPLHRDVEDWSQAWSRWSSDPATPYSDAQIVLDSES